MPHKTDTNTDTMPNSTKTNRRVRRAKKDDAPKKSASKKSKAAEPAPAPVPASEPVEVSPVVSEANGLIEELTGLVKSLREENARLRDSQRTTLSTVDALMKKTVKYIRKSTKGARPKRKASPNSGFNKPVPVTDEACEFMDVEPGTLVSRTQLTQSIRDYIKSNNLKDPSDGRIFHANDSLANLLQVETGETLTLFNMNKHLSHLFPKVEAEE